MKSMSCSDMRAFYKARTDFADPMRTRTACLGLSTASKPGRSYPSAILPDRRCWPLHAQRASYATGPARDPRHPPTPQVSEADRELTSWPAHDDTPRASLLASAWVFGASVSGARVGWPLVRPSLPVRRGSFDRAGVLLATPAPSRTVRAILAPVPCSPMLRCPRCSCRHPGRRPTCRCRCLA